MMNDPWAFWKASMDGHKLPIGDDAPYHGYYRLSYWESTGCPKRAKKFEAIAFSRTESGESICYRQRFGGGENMKQDEIAELFGQVCRSPLSWETYDAVANKGQPWPSEVVESTDETTAIGHNNPPAELSPSDKLTDRIKKLGQQLARCLKEWNGAPKTKAEADTVANFATKFKELAKEATDKHKIEKDPFLEGGRRVDASWFPVRDLAEASRKKALAIADAWINAETAKLADEARIANEAARKAAEQEAKITGEAPAPIVEVTPSKVTVGTAKTVSQRTRKDWIVTDLKSFVVYLASMDEPPSDLLETCHILARRLGTAGVKAPGIEQKDVSSTS